MKKAQIPAYFSHHSKALVRLAKVVHTSPTVENVHKMRTTIRRIRSVLALNKLEDKKLKTLAQKLGKQRDLDVAIINAEKLKLKTDKLKSAQKKQQQITKKILSPKKVEALKQELNELCEFIRKSPPLKLVKKLQVRQKKLAELKHHKMNATELHKARILVKKLRYQLEAMGRREEKLKNLQDLLGEIHDLEILEEKIGFKGRVTKAKKAKIRQLERL